MASAAPPKRMVSSVFITLASPYRATVTQQQHALQTHSAPAKDKQHTAVRVHPSDSILAVSQRHKKDSVSSESCVNPGQTVGSTRGSRAEASFARAAPGLEEPQTTKVSEGLLSHVRSLPTSLGTDLTEGSSPQLRPVSREVPCPLLSPGQSQVSNNQQSPQNMEKRTPSSGEHQVAQTHSIPNNVQELSPEGKEVCGFCRKTVALNEPAIEALNRTYHDSCFQCRQCHVPLAAKLYYNKAGIPLCEDCYQASLELCWACGEVIKDHVIRALERTYHPSCFICITCSQQIGEERFAQGEVGEVYCIQDYYRKYAPQCSACKQLIIPTEDGTDSYTVECLGRSFHEDCYRCEICVIQLSPEPNDHGCHPLDGRVLCKSCHLSLVSSQN